jgi:hypothetical protein
VSRVDIYQNTNQKQKSDEGVDCIIFFSANANRFYLKITEKILEFLQNIYEVDKFFLIVLVKI